MGTASVRLSDVLGETHELVIVLGGSLCRLDDRVRERRLRSGRKSFQRRIHDLHSHGVLESLYKALLIQWNG